MNDFTNITVECPECDPDNPFPRVKGVCTVCGGTGRAPIALSIIKREITASMVEPKKRRKALDEEIYLEY
jgi:hypothetical protein